MSFVNKTAIFKKRTMSKSHKFEDKQILTKLAKDFHDLVANKDQLRPSVENFLNNIVDELTLGIIFDCHRKIKTQAYEIEAEEDEGDDEDDEVFAQDFRNKTQVCVCPICDRAVAATKFAPHLAWCMGMGRSCSRNASRRVASSSKDRESNSSFSGVPSDDEDDIDWNSATKRGKKKKKNGNKRPKGGTPNKRSGDSLKLLECVDIEADDDDLSSLRDLLQDHSNSSSPADSVSSSQSGSSKKKKNKNKKSKRDRSSPSSTLSAD